MAYACTAMLSRSAANWLMIAPKPPFSSPMRFPAGTRTASNPISAVSEHSQPIFRSGADTDTPGASRSITSSEMPPAPGPPVRTAVVMKSARVPEVM